MDRDFIKAVTISQNGSLIQLSATTNGVKYQHLVLIPAKVCHSREGGNPSRAVLQSEWIPAYAGMTKLLFPAMTGLCRNDKLFVLDAHL